MLGGGGCCPGGREPDLRRSVGISRIKHVCTYSILYTQSILGVRALSPSTPSLASHHRARSILTIHPPIVHKRSWWRPLEVPGSGAAAALFTR